MKQTAGFPVVFQRYARGGPAECARPSLSLCKAYTASNLPFVSFHFTQLSLKGWPNSKRFAHSAGPDPKYVFYQKHSCFVRFRLYGDGHRLSYVISHRLDGSASKVKIFFVFGTKVSKLAFGSVKNESGAWDLPQDASMNRCGIYK